jgi:hypothetical protein
MIQGARGRRASAERPVTLKVLARHVELSPTTVSIVLNNAPGAEAIPVATRERVFEAAKELKYRPNLHARLLGSSHGRKLTPRAATAVDVEEQEGRIRALEQQTAKLHRVIEEMQREWGQAGTSRSRK